MNWIGLTGNSKQHFAFSAYCRLQGWNKLADKWKEEAEEEWEEAEEVLNRLVELGCENFSTQPSFSQARMAGRITVDRIPMANVRIILFQVCLEEGFHFVVGNHAGNIVIKVHV